MNVVIVLPDGKGVRNFLLGRLFATVARQGQTCVLHIIPSELLSQYQTEPTAAVRWEPLLDYRESPISYSLRHSLAYAQMYWGDTQAMRYNRVKRVKGSWRTQMAHRTARLVGQAAASPRGIDMLDRWHSREVGKVGAVEDYRQLFREVRPAVLLCSHQRPPAILPPVLAARSLGIPTATFIFSWDNLTSKGRIAAPFDHYFVWSEHMRGEMGRYYPRVPRDHVHVIGTPQFDPYADSALLWRREEFFRRVGADPARPLICYSGGDAGTCPEDHLHLRLLLDLIRANKIHDQPQVLLRPAPGDPGTRYAPVRREYPELLYAQPAWVHTEPGNWAKVLPLPDDVQFLANLTQHADLNVNLASTMTLDFAIHDKPVVNIAFDIADPPPFGKPLWDYYYRYEHYRPVVEIGAARFARSADQLAEHVNAYLADPGLDRERRRELVALQVGQPIGRSSDCIFETLQSIADSAVPVVA